MYISKRNHFLRRTIKFQKVGPLEISLREVNIIRLILSVIMILRRSLFISSLTSMLLETKMTN